MTGAARLYHFALDPASRQARLALAEKGAAFEPVPASPWEADSALAALNPAGLPPVLEHEDEGGMLRICGSRAILEYLEEISPEPALLPGGPAERAETRRLIDWFDRKYDGEVNAWLLHEKIEKRLQGLGAPDPAAIRAGRDALRWHLDYVGALLETREGLAGPRFSLADIAAAAHLSCADYLGEAPWDSCPPAKAWYQRIKCRPSFRAILADRLPGLAPADGYQDLDF
ncbi:glutathione S-transferase family protein [Alkalicaulis satelles]|uniref:Glutathione S-transferase family protein n=1 Tax=Alkalicaulis satelles TaxID=2609175 RepID=A0A5M6ZGE5_9PROT|nr:glutathione S-transferase family protein [Alkalicaulis satelles]KAA5803789.1 glutathione S-transferase family protein [Alkalicaulis satelles]